MGFLSRLRRREAKASKKVKPKRAAKPVSDIKINQNGQYYKVFESTTRDGKKGHTLLQTNKDALNLADIQAIKDYIKTHKAGTSGERTDDIIQVNEIYSYDGGSGMKRQLRKDGIWITKSTLLRDRR